MNTSKTGFINKVNKSLAIKKNREKCLEKSCLPAQKLLEKNAAASAIIFWLQSSKLLQIANKFVYVHNFIPRLKNG